MKPYVSIIIPTFNRCNTLFRAIESVLSQSFTKWELIIVDDGSNDGTEALLQKHMLNDTRIRFIKRPSDRPKGANACRNIGIENAKGKYVAFLDSDDEWLESKLDADLEYMESNDGFKGLHSGIIIDDGDKKTEGQSRNLHQGESYVDFIFSNDVLTQTSTFFVETDSASNIKFDESLQRHQDMDFFIRFGRKYNWHYVDQYNTIIHWKKGSHRSHHFDSMIRFYERYESQISLVNKKARYLTWSWVLAQTHNKRYKSYYLSALRELRPLLSKKYRVFILFPEFGYSIWKISSGLFKRYLKKTFDQSVY